MNPDERRILGIGFSIIFLVAFIFALDYASKPSFCRFCHEMKEAYNSWENSSHHGFDCRLCHTKPGAIGSALAYFKGVKGVFLHFTGGFAKPIKSRVGNENCLKCHQEVTLIKWVGKRKVEHHIHLKNEIQCTDCHSRVVHGATKFTDTEAPKEKDCKRCHKEVKDFFNQ